MTPCKNSEEPDERLMIYRYFKVELSDWPRVGKSRRKLTFHQIYKVQYLEVTDLQLVAKIPKNRTGGSQDIAISRSSCLIGREWE